MEIILDNYVILLVLWVASTVLAFLSLYTRHSLVFSILQGVMTLSAFCFLIYKGATIEELLLTVMVFLLPSMLGVRRRQDK